jgi:RNA polymerase sigma-70 factor (ECF subfamily)
VDAYTTWALSRHPTRRPGEAKLPSTLTTADSVRARPTGALPPVAATRSAQFADAESRAWLADLRATGPRHDRAIERLHELLLRAARFEVGRRRGSLPHVGESEYDSLAHQSADDALVAVLAKLDGYRGASRFTTWAYKFALLEAGVKLRRRAWQDREIVLGDEGWSLLADSRANPAGEAETNELLRALAAAMASDLSPHQRDVLVAVALNGVPIDVLAERLSTTRGALYKTLHDARRKLRARLARDGYAIDSIQGGAR